MFEIGDKIILKNFGVCEIKEIETIDFNNGQGPIDYFVIIPLFHDTDSKIRIPISQSANFKSIISKKKALELIKILKDKNKTSIWIDNAKERKTLFNNLFIDGDEEDIIRIIYAIDRKKEEFASLKTKKMISMTDKGIYDKCIRLIYEEFAIIFSLRYDEVDRFIKEKLKK